MEIIVMFLAACMPVVLHLIILPRSEMKHRADTRLKEMPDHESTIAYLALSGTLPNSRKREIDAKIVLMKEDGWTFLKMSEATPMKTIRSWGGGVNLYFIRPTQ